MGESMTEADLKALIRQRIDRARQAEAGEIPELESGAFIHASWCQLDALEALAALCGVDVPVRGPEIDAKNQAAENAA